MFSHTQLTANRPTSRPLNSVNSMSNIRRSVTDTLSSKFRPKPTLVVSPSTPTNMAPCTSTTPSLQGLGLAVTVPTSASDSPVVSPGEMGERSRQVGAGLGPMRTVGSGPRRQPISPTMHSRGSILMETKAIVDEESRRLSEMAFLA